MESAAVEIRTYETELVPGLLQTESYTRALIEAVTPELAAEEVQRMIDVRAERQGRLLNEDRTRLLVVVNEAAVRRIVGGAEVMTEQLGFLLEVNRVARIEIQVVPEQAGAHPAIGNTFVLIRFPNDTAPTLAYTETLTSAAHHDRQADVDTYTLTFDRLRAVALSPSDSATRIEQTLREWRREQEKGTRRGERSRQRQVAQKQL